MPERGSLSEIFFSFFSFHTKLLNSDSLFINFKSDFPNFAFGNSIFSRSIFFWKVNGKRTGIPTSYAPVKKYYFHQITLCILTMKI